MISSYEHAVSVAMPNPQYRVLGLYKKWIAVKQPKHVPGDTWHTRRGVATQVTQIDVLLSGPFFILRVPSIFRGKGEQHLKYFYPPFSFISPSLVP
jgi:hypothetical protein